VDQLALVEEGNMFQRTDERFVDMVPAHAHWIYPDSPNVDSGAPGRANTLFNFVEMAIADIDA
jgi:hypothetical protein